MFYKDNFFLLTLPKHLIFGQLIFIFYFLL